MIYIRKILLFVLLLCTGLLLVDQKTNAYVSLSIATNEAKADSNQVNMTMVAGESYTPFGSGWYVFTLQYARNFSGYYLLFGDITYNNMLLSNTYGTISTVILDNNNSTMNSKNWLFGLGSSGTTFYVYIYSASQAIADTTIQAFIDTNWYVYYDTATTSKSTAVTNFMTRYVTIAEEALDARFESGRLVGWSTGYEQGYEDGTLANNEAVYNNGYDDGYNDGYDESYTPSYNEGYSDARDTYGYFDTVNWLGYDDGYSAGVIQGSDNVAAITDFIPGILGVIFGFFFQLASISFMGISILQVLSAFLTVVVLLMILKVFGGSK